VCAIYEQLKQTTAGCQKVKPSLLATYDKPQTIVIVNETIKIRKKQ